MADVVFQSNLGNVMKATDEAMRRACEIIGGTAVKNAKENVTVAVYSTPEGWYIRTGDLRDRIDHATEEKGGEYTVSVGSNLEYAPYVELGTGIHAGGNSKAKSIPWRYMGSDGQWHITSGMPPRPFIRPAIEDHIQEYKEILEGELGSI